MLQHHLESKAFTLTNIFSFMLTVQFGKQKQDNDSVGLLTYVYHLDGWFKSQICPKRDVSTVCSVCEGKVQLISMSPESLLSNPSWWDMLHTAVYWNVSGWFFVNEAHCVKKWLVGIDTCYSRKPDPTSHSIDHFQYSTESYLHCGRVWSSLWD